MKVNFKIIISMINKINSLVSQINIIKTLIYIGLILSILITGEYYIVYFNKYKDIEIVINIIITSIEDSQLLYWLIIIIFGTFVFVIMYNIKSIVTKLMKIYKSNYVTFIDKLFIIITFISLAFIGINSSTYTSYKWLIKVIILFIVINIILRFFIPLCGSKVVNKIQKVLTIVKAKLLKISKSIIEFINEKIFTLETDNTTDTAERIAKYISDKYATKDTLERDHFVNYLKYALVNIEVESSFVIGLNGKWGEGKTTIIQLLSNNLKNEYDIITVNFNPWFSNSKEDIIKRFYDSIANALEDNLISPGLIHMIYKYKDIVSETLKPKKLDGVVNVVFPLTNSSKSVNYLSNKISSILKSINKRIVIIIDDLDRTEKEEILLVFKLIKICSNIDNFIYLVSFDKEHIENILESELKIDKNYLEKVIQ